MENVLTFLRDYERLLQIVEFISLFVFGILLYKKSGNINYLKEVFDEMRYRTQNYNVVEDKNVKTGELSSRTVSTGQTFSPLKDVYRLNKTTGYLEKTNEQENIHELVNSYKDLSLNAMYDRFLPSQEFEDTLVAESEDLLDKIDFMQEAFLASEEMKQRYKLDESMSMQDVFKFAQEKSKQVNENLLNLEKKFIEQKKATQIDYKSEYEKLLKEKELNAQKEIKQESK